jgi:type VI secretion system protein ImpG
MDPRLLQYYNRELQFIRDMGGEFAAEYPKIAGRLALDAFECADPYVERLLEGFSLLAARVQLKIDAEFPRFTQHLLESIYPHYLAPTPSVVVAEFQPDPAEASLTDGFPLPRGTVLRGAAAESGQTQCEFRTAHEVTLWPLRVLEAEYFSHTGAMRALKLPDVPGAKAGIRIRLGTTGGVKFERVSIDKLVLHLRGGDQRPMHIFEQMHGNALAVVVMPASRPAPWHELIDRSVIRRVGYDDDHALFPYGPRSFQGYRLLHEYFTLPARYMFVEIGGLARAARNCREEALDLIVLFDRSHRALENAVDASNFALHCAPAVNLFPHRADRIHLTDQTDDYQVLPDRTRPMDLEVYQVTGVVGHGATAAERQEFLPLYALSESGLRGPGQRYYSVRRVPRLLSAAQRRAGTRTGYVGSEVYLSVVDMNEAPYAHELRQLSVETLCTNRDLPMIMPVGRGETDFVLDASGPVRSIRCLAGPTRPMPSHAHGEIAWRLISHLSLNYLSLVDQDSGRGAEAIRELLSLYSGMTGSALQKQIEGVRSIACRPITRRLEVAGQSGFGRGLEITLTLDESRFEGTGVFLLGSVLEQFFSKYVSINSFTETVVSTLERNEVIRWPARTGRRHAV